MTVDPAGQAPDPGRIAGGDLGIIHPYAVAGPGGEALLVSGRAIRAEHRMHLADRKARARAVARRAPKPGQRGSRRWRHYRRRQRLAEARHRRRVRQAQHEAAKTVIAWAVDRRVGALAVGDPRGVLNNKAGRRHNQRTRDWRIGHLIIALTDKAGAAGISLTLVDERGTSSTCPACASRIPKPPARARPGQPTPAGPGVARHPARSPEVTHLNFQARALVRSSNRPGQLAPPGSRPASPPSALSSGR